MKVLQCAMHVMDGHTIKTRLFSMCYLGNEKAIRKVLEKLLVSYKD